MIQVSNLDFHYSGSKHQVFEDFSLRLEENKIYGLLGKNGTGKSTLLYLLSGMLRPRGGEVTVDGRAAKERHPEMLQDIFFVSEEFELPAIKLRDYVRLHSPFYPNFSQEVLETCLREFELTSDVHISKLSMGQKKKVFMSFALAAGTKYLFLDEPTNGLDIPSKSQFRKVIANTMTEERTAIISTHQVKDIDTLLDHVVMLEGTRLLLDASVAELTSRYAFELRTPSQMDESVLYAEPSLAGNAVVARNDNGRETAINLELLFNAASQGKLL